MSEKPSVFESAKTPTTREGSIENIERDLRKQDGDLRVQGERIAALIAKEPFLATKEWVYHRVVPIVGVFLVGIIYFLQNVLYNLMNFLKEYSVSNSFFH